MPMAGGYLSRNAEERGTRRRELGFEFVKNVERLEL